MIFFSCCTKREEEQNAILESEIKMDSQMPSTIGALGGEILEVEVEHLFEFFGE